MSSRPYRPGPDADMYDDQEYSSEYRQHGAPGYDSYQSRKDNSRSPLRGPASGRQYDSEYTERAYRDERNQHGNRYERGYDRERSRSPRRENRGRYTDRDREGYKSPVRGRSRSPSPYHGAPPNRTIIFEGLPLDFTQEDISKELQTNFKVEGVEEIRLIKDKKTGISRGFAFAQFYTLPEAKRFLEEHYPTVSFHGPSQALEPSKVRIAYSREKTDQERASKHEDDWKCDVCYTLNYSYRMMCFKCNGPRTRSTAHGVVVAQENVSSYSGFATTGDSDASPDETASQFLLLRGLEPGVTEELLAKGVCKLYKTKATTSGDTHTAKKTKISSTSGDASLGAKEGSLRRVLLIRDRKTNDSWRYGFAEFGSVEDAQNALAKYNATDKFTISSKPVIVSHIHAGVFVPVLEFLNEESARFTFNPLSNSAISLMYWDATAYASEFSTVIPEAPVKHMNNQRTKIATAAANEGLVGGKDGEPRSKKRKVEKESAAGTKTVVAPHLQFWTNRHNEIHGLPAKDFEDNDSDSTAGLAKSTPEPIADSSPTQSYADLGRKCCLLCSRQFKTEAEVNKHERISQLHRDNTKNEELVSKALAKLKKSESDSVSAESSAYRDRAKERRQAFNQPKQPAAQHSKSKTPSSTTSPPSHKDEQSEHVAPVQSKGAALLGKMGWNAGEGLGAQGTGRTEAIATELYTQGVGLGAEGGKLGDAMKEAERQTKGDYKAFVGRTKEKAKERYETLG
ncbi:hypothetical protein BCIN_06g04710 [Botrytis cinerea B05.10]|uniref:Rna-binding protein n=1 Tax=Botryotinia fuckeliana (strain B05.10) TaxID=332648 RepID=A0A384JKY1_BOTFB|nr:hypothetical protein BCIN_06g04710 [Botrytis cinerea B05.10]ATZ51024.1 hypothetical protein BCIN_06g04710 [Botrytis cinerea B05.10]